MQFKFRFLFSLFLYLFFASCEEVVNPELLSADPVLVIDGIVSNFQENNHVILSKTAPFNSPDPNPMVSGAEVNLNYDNEIIELVEVEPGMYKPAKFQKIPVNTAVTLTVFTESRFYEAKSVIPNQLLLDSVTVIKREEDISFEDGYYTIAHFTENGSTINYYMWEVYLNGEFVSRDEIILSNDENLNGKQVAFELPFSIDLENANAGDTLLLLNYSISETTYNYYNGLLSLATSGSPAQAVPDNPITNIKGGALGYFNACQLDTASVILKFD